MVLDILLAAFLFVGLIIGLKFGLRQAGGLATMVLGVTILAVVLSSTFSWVIFMMFGGTDYSVRTGSFLGILLLGYCVGVRYVINKFAHSEQQLPFLVDRPVGALFGVLTGLFGFLSLMVFSLQLPFLAGSLAAQFAPADRAGEAQGKAVPVILQGLSSGMEPVRSQIQPNPAASVLVSAVGGRIAGDYHACYSTAFNNGQLDAMRLFMNLSVFTNFYSTSSLEQNSPWLSHAISQIREISALNRPALLQKAGEVFLNGSVDEMNAFLTAINVVQGQEFDRVRQDGDAIRRTVGWGQRYLAEGSSGKAATVYRSYLNGNRNSAYRERIMKEATAVGITSGTRLPADRGATTTPTATIKPTHTPADVVQELKAFKFKSAAKMAQALVSSPSSSDQVEQLLDQANHLSALHRTLLQKIRLAEDPVRLTDPGSGLPGVVVGAFEGSVALKIGDSVKTVAWKNFSPESLLPVYMQFAADNASGIETYKEVFGL